MAIDWWDRPDVKKCLQYFYNILDNNTFTIVGRRFGKLIVANDDVINTLDRFKPIEYIGFGLCGWPSPELVLNQWSKRTRVDIDLDNFPYAHQDLLRLREWAQEHNLEFMAYFTGSRGYRVCLGKTDIPIFQVREELARFREMLRLWTLDIVPYTIGVGGWSQPPGGLNRKSDLPLFILEKTPRAHYDVFQEAILIRDDRKSLYTPNDPLNGDEFIKCVREMYEGLEDKERRRVEVRARRFVAKRVTKPIYYEYGYRYETT